MKVFADTSYFVALVLPRDQGHAEAVAAATSVTAMVTTEYVLTELGAALSRTADRPRFVATIRELEADSQVEIVPASRELFRAGIERFSERMDKNWSLTDCISFIVMERRQLSDALTADHHFEQAGFVALLK